MEARLKAHGVTLEFSSCSQNTTITRLVVAIKHVLGQCREQMVNPGSSVARGAEHPL